MAIEQQEVEEMDDLLSGLEEIANSTAEAIAQAQRDPAIPEGTYLGTTDLEGAATNWKKQASLVNIGGKPLPERVTYWHNNLNRYVDIATAMLPQVLQERDDSGHPVFTRKPPAGFTERVLIEELQCPIVVNGKRVHMGIGNGNGFYSEEDFEAHMEILHPREANSIRRAEERQLREEEIALRRQEMEAIVALAKGGTPEVAAPRIREYPGVVLPEDEAMPAAAVVARKPGTRRKRRTTKAKV